MSKKSPLTKPAGATTTAADLPPEVTQQPTPKTQFDRESADIFSALRDELGAGSFVTISRAHPAAGQHKHAYEGTLPIDECTLENITQIYGGGDFILKGKTSTGAFSGAERRFSISHSIPPKNPRQAVAEKKEPPPQDAAALVKAVADAMPKSDPTGGVVVDILKTLLNRPEPKADGSLMEFFKMQHAAQLAAEERTRQMIEESNKRTDRLIQTLAEKMQGEPQQSHLEWLREQEEIDELRGVGKRSGGSRDEPSTMEKIIMEGMKALPQILQQFAGGAGQTPQMGQPRVALSPLKNPASPASSPIDITATTPAPMPAAPTQPPTLNPIALAAFRTGAIKAAQKQKDFYDFIDGQFDTLESIAPDYIETVFEIARSDDWFSLIFAGEPEALKHTAWLNDMRSAVLERGMVTKAHQAHARQRTAADAAIAAFAWAPVEFRDWVLNLCEDDAGWAEVFKSFDQKWAAEFRTELTKIFAEPQNVVPMEPKAAAPASSPKPARVAGEEKKKAK